MFDAAAIGAAVWQIIRKPLLEPPRHHSLCGTRALAAASGISPAMRTARVDNLRADSAPTAGQCRVCIDPNRSIAATETTALQAFFRFAERFKSRIWL